MVTTTTYVVTGVEFSTTLTNDDATCQNRFATETFYTQTFCIGVTTVTSRATSLFMCHLSDLLLSADASNFHISEPLTVASLLTVVLTTTKLNDFNFLATTVSNDFSFDNAA